VSGDPALDRFLRSLAARDASPNTQRAYSTAVGAYLDWLDSRGADWRSPGRATLRAYLAHLTEGHARSSVAQRLAAIRSFHRFAARAGLATGDPWGAIATPRLPRRLPRVLEVEEVERLLAVIDEDLAAAPAEEGGTALALALRDRAVALLVLRRVQPLVARLARIEELDVFHRDFRPIDGRGIRCHGRTRGHDRGRAKQDARFHRFLQWLVNMHLSCLANCVVA